MTGPVQRSAQPVGARICSVVEGPPELVRPSDDHLLFFCVGTNDTPQGNLENIKHDSKAGGEIVTGMEVVDRAAKRRGWSDAKGMQNQQDGPQVG